MRLPLATSYFNCSSRKRESSTCGAKLNARLWFNTETKEFFETVEGAKKQNQKNAHVLSCRACHKSRLPPSVATLRYIDNLLVSGLSVSAIEERLATLAKEKTGAADDGRIVAQSHIIASRQRLLRVAAAPMLPETSAPSVKIESEINDAKLKLSTGTAGPSADWSPSQSADESHATDDERSDSARTSDHEPESAKTASSTSTVPSSAMDVDIKASEPSSNPSSGAAPRAG